MTHINFIRLIPLYFTLSAIVLAAGIFSLVTWQLRPAVDFVGGSLLQTKIDSTATEVSESTIRDALSSAQVEAGSIQTAGSGEWIIRTKTQSPDIERVILSALEEKFGSAETIRFESVGPILGRELLIKTITAIILAAGGILLYVAWRFRGSKYGICADLAMLHDSLVVIGVFSLLGHFYGIEVDTLFVTALLTILSFSVHDTIVVYDRIRENLRRYPQEAYEAIINRSINETLRRSINNSLTIIFMLTALTLLGGETIKPFALALLVGTITGTYSSTFTAAPLLVIWNKLEGKKKKKHR